MPETPSPFQHAIAAFIEERLAAKLAKLPRNLRGSEITELRRRLDAVSQAGGSLPIPKGPMPTSARQVRRPR